jgi:hypothetical protein
MFFARAEGEGKKNNLSAKINVTFSHIMWKKSSKLFCSNVKKFDDFFHIWCEKIIIA